MVLTRIAAERRGYLNRGTHDKFIEYPTHPCKIFSNIFRRRILCDGGNVSYIVTQTAVIGAAIDLEFDLNDALAHACQLLAERAQDVAIQDGSRKSIRGDDLIACCHGKKVLTPDLRAIPQPEP
jgi:hypothetical protein